MGSDLRENAGQDHQVSGARERRIERRAAFASFEEGFKGSLEVGKVADLVALAEDLSQVPVERLREVGVVMTLVGGEVVCEA